MRDLLGAEFTLHFIELRRYWFESVGAVVVTTAVFLGLYFGVRHVSGVDEQPLLVFNYLLWAFAAGAYSSACDAVVRDIHTGITQQLALCPGGLRDVLAARAAVGTLTQFGYAVVLVGLTMVVTGEWIAPAPLPLVVSLLLGAPSLVGLGFALAGLGLVFKRITTLAALANFLLIGVVVLEGLPLGWTSVVPFSPAASLARNWALHGAAATIADFGIVIGNSAVYLGLGVLVFSSCDNYARSKDLLGTY